MISVQKVPRTCSILALGIPVDAITEFISLYFEKHSGGTEVTDVKRIGDHVVVTFASFEGDVNVFMLYLSELLCY